MSKASINWTDHILNFVSVIVGVSLAFIISSRSEQSKQENEFNQNISAILEELDSDIYTFESYQIPDNKEKLVRMKDAIQMIASQSGSDSVSVQLMSFFDVNNYSPSNITINSLITSGKLDLLNDYDLKTNILYYQNLADELESQGKFQVEFLMDRITPWFIENAPYFMGEKNYIDDYKGDDSEAIMIFSLYIAFVENKIAKYESALKDAKSLKELLTKYQEEEGLNDR
ncbi:MAG: hypothetical protein ABJG47_15325 [Ekhidna sp.]